MKRRSSRKNPKKSNNRRVGKGMMKRGRRGPKRVNTAMPITKSSSAFADVFMKKMQVVSTVGYSSRYEPGAVSVIYPMFDDGFSPSSNNACTGYWSWIDIDTNLLKQADFGYLFQTYQSYRVQSINVNIRFKDSAAGAKIMSTTPGYALGISNVGSFKSAIKLMDGDMFLNSVQSVPFGKYFGTDPVATLGDIHGTRIVTGPRLSASWTPSGPTDENWILATQNKLYARVLYCTDYKYNLFIDGLLTAGVNADITLKFTIQFANLLPNGIQSGRVDFRTLDLETSFENI